MHTIRVAHSPDSDDAFMYYGLACGAVKPDGIRFEQALSDIESANAAAQEGRFDLTAISAAAYPSLAARYLLLDSGASFGDGYGPCVVVPAGSAVRRLEDLAGLVIHEGQLTAAAEGLRVVEDLGKSWKARTGLPLPLGLNAVKRELPEAVRRAAAIAWKASIDHGLAHRAQALDYAMTFARGLPRDQADTFVGMYVNDWTRELGPRGREAVARFLGEAARAGLVPRVAIEYQER